MNLKVIVIVGTVETEVFSLQELNDAIKKEDPSVAVTIEFHEYGPGYEGVVSAEVQP